MIQPKSQARLASVEAAWSTSSLCITDQALERSVFGVNVEFLDIWDKSLLIANSIWFKQTWNLQEVLLSSESVFVEENWRTGFETLASAPRNRKCHLFNKIQCCKKSLGMLPRSKTTAVDHFSVQIELIRGLRQDHSSRVLRLDCRDMVRSFPEFYISLSMKLLWH